MMFVIFQIKLFLQNLQKLSFVLGVPMTTCRESTLSDASVSRSVPVLLSPSRQILMAAAGASEPLND